MKKGKIALGIGVLVLVTVVGVTVKSAWGKRQGERNFPDLEGAEYQEKEDASTFMATDQGILGDDVYLADEPVDVKAEKEKEAEEEKETEGEKEAEGEAYPWECEWYGPYDERDYKEQEKFDIWYDENGMESHRLKEGYRELAYESVSCMERTEEAETLLVYDGSYTPYGEQEVGAEAMDGFWERKGEGLPACIVEDGYGFVKACYEEDAYKIEGVEGASNEYCMGFRWTMDGGMCYYGRNVLKLVGDSVMYSTLQVHITQSQKGKSYLVLKNHDTGEKVRILGTETEDGWHGTIKLGGIPEASYSIGIENASGERIVYRGMYGL